MATIYFSLSSKKIGSKQQIMVRFGHTKINQRAKTGLYIEEDYWDNELQAVRIPKPRLCTDQLLETIKELRETESQLRDLRISIEDAFTKAPSTPLVDKNWLKDIVQGESATTANDAIQDFFGAWDTYINLQRVSTHRKNKYITVKKLLFRFEQVRKMKSGKFFLAFDNFTPLLLSEFEKFLWEEDTYKKKYPQIYVGKRDVKRGQNSISSYLKLLRGFFNWAVDNDLVDTSPFAKFKIKAEVYGTPIYITKDERNKFLTHPMSNEKLNLVRDIFVFQCCIGCRVSDLLKLTKNNVIDGAIEYIAGKTADEHPITLRVPLNKMALAIIEKYEDPARDTLLPFLHRVRYNIYLKKCFQEAGLTRTITKFDSRLGEERQMPICDYVASHMARRTFVGNLYKQVQDPNLIGALSGHTEGSKAIARYRDIDEDLKRKTVALLE